MKKYEPGQTSVALSCEMLGSPLLPDLSFVLFVLFIFLQNLATFPINICGFILCTFELSAAVHAHAVFFSQKRTHYIYTKLTHAVVCSWDKLNSCHFVFSCILLHVFVRKRLRSCLYVASGYKLYKDLPWISVQDQNCCVINDLLDDAQLFFSEVAWCVLAVLLEHSLIVCYMDMSYMYICVGEIYSFA